MARFQIQINQKQKAAEYLVEAYNISESHLDTQDRVTFKLPFYLLDRYT